MNVDPSNNHLMVKRLDAEEHDFFIAEVSKAIKNVQHLAASNLPGVPITFGEWQLQHLVDRLDYMFLYGLKNYMKGYLEVFREYTHQSISKEIFRLANVTTDIGRSRAWLLHALRDQLLGSYLYCILLKTKYLSKYYEKRSIFFDNQRIELLVTLLSGLENIEFNLHLDVCHLDLYCCKEVPLKLDTNRSVTNESMPNDHSKDNVEVCRLPTSETLAVECPVVDRLARTPRDCTEIIALDGSDDKVLVEHIPRRKKKTLKGKDKDDGSSISSDSSSFFVADVSHDSTFDGSVKCRPSPEEEAFKMNSRKSEESALFDEVYEKVVFGKSFVHSSRISETFVEEFLASQSSDATCVCETECLSRLNLIPDEVTEDDSRREDEVAGCCLREKGTSGREILSTEGAAEESVVCAPVEDVSSGCTEELEFVVAGGADDDSREEEVASNVESNDWCSLTWIDPNSLEAERSSFDFRASNNLKVMLLLDIFTDNNEILLKIFQVFQNFMEGKPFPLLLVTTSTTIYFLISYNRKLRLHSSIAYEDLGSLSVGLFEQSLDFVSKNKTRYSVCTGSSHLTRILVEEVLKGIEAGSNSNRVVVMRDATNQKISIKRWAGRMYSDLKKANSMEIKGFFLVSYHFRASNSDAVKMLKSRDKEMSKKGYLYVLSQVQHIHGIVPMWRKAYFVLRNGVLREFEDESRTVLNSATQLPEWSDCKKCERSQHGKKYCFSLVPSSSLSTSSPLQEPRSIDRSKFHPKMSPSQFFRSLSSQLPKSDSKRSKAYAPAVTLSCKSKEDAKDWIASLKSAIRGSHEKDTKTKIEHGCCILLDNSIHLGYQNSVSCDIHHQLSLPTADLVGITQRCKSTSLLLKNKSDEAQEIQTLESDKELEDRFEILNFDDFEFVEHDDAVDDVLPPNSISSSWRLGDERRESRTSSNGVASGNALKTFQAAGEKRLDVFFRSLRDCQQFASEVASMYSSATSTDLAIKFESDSLPMSGEVDKQFDFCDWNSLEGVSSGTC